MTTNEFILGDYRDLIKNIEDDSIDFILSDPPYGIDYQCNYIDNKYQKNIINDKKDSIDWDLLLSELYRVLKPNRICFLFGRTDMFLRIGNNIINSKFKYCHDFIWRKGDMGSGNLKLMGTIHEMGLVLSKGNPQSIQPLKINNEIKQRYKAEFFEKLSENEKYGHLTQKPIALLSYLISAFTIKDEYVFDPFGGSNSTNIAAKLLNRNSISFEMDEHFFDLGTKRIQDEDHLNYLKNKNLNVLMYNENGLLTYKKGIPIIRNNVNLF